MGSRPQLTDQIQRLIADENLWFGEDSPKYQSDPDLKRAVSIIESYQSECEDQTRFQTEMLAFAAAHPELAHKRECVPGHFTASAMLLDAKGERFLLTHHRKLERWLQLGGHCDGDANLPAGALREACEESGIQGLKVCSTPLDLDIHSIPARPAKGDRPAEPEHLHLDVRFLVSAPPGAQLAISEESLDLGWFGPNEIDELALDNSVKRLFELCFETDR